MSKTKVIGVVCGAVVLIMGLGLGYWVWHNQSQQKAQARVLGTASGSGVDSVSLSQPTSDDSIPLTPAKPSTSDSGGLQVGNGSGGDLGQLNPDQGTQGTSSSSGSSSKANPFDPSTFAQYDKYKSGEAALFGDVQKGTGDTLTSGKKAAVYYRGWLTDGTLFDQSRPDDKGQLQPFVFTLGAHQVIPGWEEALDGMKVGGVRLIIVPPSVGYGAAGQGPIPGNSVLIFQVQLGAVQ